MEWQVSAFAWDTPATKREIRAAKSRKLNLRLNAPSTFAFSMLGDHPQAKLITELVTDVVVQGGGVDMLRARCGNTQDTIAESGYGVTFNFVDYRGVLQRRMLKSADTLVYPNTDQSAIAWGMISNVQSRARGNYAITRGLGTATGINRDWNPVAGQFVGKIIDSISNMSNGFDWDVSPAMVFDIYYPSRGANNGKTIEYPKSISSLTRTKTPSTFSNDNVITGGTLTTLIEQASTTVLTDPMGRWDGTYSYSDITDQPNLISRAGWLSTRTGLILPAYSVKLTAGWWQGLSHIGLGDTVRLVAKRGRVNDNVLFRVLEIEVAIGDSGGEDVRLSLAGL